MLDTDEFERFNFEQLVDYVEKNYDKEGNLISNNNNIKEDNNNGNNLNNNKEDNNTNNNRGKVSPMRKRFKK